MRKISLTATVIAATLSTAALAADWVFMGENWEGTKFHIDRESIRTTPDGNKRTWVRSCYGKRDEEGNTGDQTLYEFDCNEGRYRGLQASWFIVREETRKLNRPGPWEYIAPETVIDTVLNYVCFGKLPY